MAHTASSLPFSPLTAVSPVDGRYHGKTQALQHYFSEYALIRYRVLVEIEYFIFLCSLGLPQLPQLDAQQELALRQVYEGFSVEDAEAIKATERTTNHDVKAVEYFCKDQLRKLGLEQVAEFVHFGLTSQDVNNTAIPLSLKHFVMDELSPALVDIVEQLDDLAHDWAQIPMLARTHGQPASPTRLGKELAVFSARLRAQLHLLSQVPFSAKFGGATGNFNAHAVAYPEVDWHTQGHLFVTEVLGLQRSYPTTQIEHYDNLAALFDGLKRVNTILIDFSRDVWQYISLGYFKQKIKAGEVGSSAMPHKVNPIDFENAEGNLGLANALFEHLAAKLPISRLQRDLTDSTVLRNLGVPMAHTMISLDALMRGLNKLELNRPALEADLEANWAVVAEAIQTILRREGIDSPYEKLKDLTRKNTAITQEDMQAFINSLDVSASVKAELAAITPHNYTGQ